MDRADTVCHQLLIPNQSVMLAPYLRAEAGRRYALGGADCGTFVAGWVRARRGVDCQPWQTASEAEALLACWGGLLRAAGHAARRSGFRLTREPQPGDVGVVALQGNIAVCAIRTTRGWVMRLDDGLALVPPEQVRVLAAWSV